MKMKNFISLLLHCKTTSDKSHLGIIVVNGVEFVV